MMAEHEHRKTYKPDVVAARAALKAAVAAGQWPGGKGAHKMTVDLIEGLDDFDLMDLYRRMGQRGKPDPGE